MIPGCCERLTVSSRLMALPHFKTNRVLSAGICQISQLSVTCNGVCPAEPGVSFRARAAGDLKKGEWMGLKQVTGIWQTVSSKVLTHADTPSISVPDFVVMGKSGGWGIGYHKCLCLEELVTAYGSSSAQAWLDLSEKGAVTQCQTPLQP